MNNTEEADILALPKTDRKKRIVVLLLKIFVFFVIYVYLFQKFDFSYLIDNLFKINLSWFYLSLIFAFAMYLVAGLRWKNVIDSMGEHLTLSSSVKIFFVGMFFSQFLLASIGGDAIRIWLATRKSLGFRISFNSTFVDRLAGLATITIFMMFSFPAYYKVVSDQLALTSLIFLVISSILGIFVVLIFDKLPLLSRIRYFQSSFGKISLDARKVFLSIKNNLIVIGLSVVVLSLTCMVVFTMGHALGQSLPILDYFIMIPPVMFITILPISLGGWGLREGAMVIAFGFLGMKGETAILLSVWFGIVLIIAALPGGFLWLFSKDLNQKI